MPTLTPTTTPEAPTLEHRRVLARVKVLIAALVVSLVPGIRGDTAWPLVLWPMYARSHPAPPLAAEEIELRVLTADGSERVLLPAGFFTHVHADLGRRLAAGAFSAGPDAQAYRSSLLSAVRNRFRGEQVLSVTARRVGWDVQPSASPPFRACCADRSEDLGRLEAQETAR